MTKLRLQAGMVLATLLLFVAALALNECVFARSEYVRGINWIYLPAGVRLLCTLLFGEAGAVGLLFASWLVCFGYFFPHDFSRAFMGGIIAAVAPYLVYRLAQLRFGLKASLVNLTPRRLLACVLAYSVASPLLYHAWLFLSGAREHLLQGLLVMFVGDLSGTLIVIYTLKGLLTLCTRRSTKLPC
ncbi:hypothetical protein BKK79_08505 [Cupriavidus sp. USMAA2-4]|uniref:MASE1 domain-containing protein n=1 Tax=Cupriavidus malaysiensis TaxID=367825 RepID=A0ABM6F1U2_9BURK|nr:MULTISPECIES: hypothetical protein [Cupriavidus]AOY91835.1 hypothetical protein BKK79_08505 [Cupriavidus sp. USMAA2-4]AOY98606.1 hypothetical protein BKK81_04415 [Cupriavidus sp. USMAHM13]AOZ05036.1 hypothetical protein BKK80_03760 [Cupriavidus malaysiensis]